MVNPILNTKIMGKKAVLTDQDSKEIKQTSIKSHRKQNKCFSLSFKTASQNFMSFLKEYHGVQNKQSQQSKLQLANLNEYFERINSFFLRQKKYTPEELQLAAVCLANLLNTFPSKINQLVFNTQFRRKIRILLLATQGKRPYRLQAVFYFLVMLIFHSRIPQSQTIRQFNQSIFKDKTIIKALLSLSQTTDKKINKLNGVLLIYMSSSIQGKKNKQVLLSKILLTLMSIHHKDTFFNLLTYLKTQKNIIVINYQDVIKGKVFEGLISMYNQQLNGYHSFLVLDFLRHLLELFPSLSSVMPQNFPLALLSFTNPERFYHPLHQITVLQFLQTSIRSITQNQKVIQKLIKIKPSNNHTAVKLCKLLLDLQPESEILLNLITNCYFDFVFVLLKSNIEIIILVKAIQITKIILNRLSQVNKSIAAYFCDSLLMKTDRSVCEQLKSFRLYLNSLRQLKLSQKLDSVY